MSERFAPLPYRALAIAGSDPFAIALVVHLYREGHSTRWGWIRTTVRDLADRVGCTRSRVVSILDALVEEEMAEREVVRLGARQEGTRVRLFDPQNDADTAVDTERTRPRTRQPRVKQVNAAGAGHVGGHGPDTSADTSTDLTDLYDLATESVTPAPPSLALVPPSADEPPEPNAFATAAAYAGQVLNPAVGRKQSAGPSRGSQLGQKLHRELRKDAVAVMAAMRFIVESQHFIAANNRAQHLGLATALRHVEEYAELSTLRAMPEARAGPTYPSAALPPLVAPSPPPSRKAQDRPS